MIVTTSITIDLLKPEYLPIVNAVQGDCNSRRVSIALHVGGSPWMIPEGTVAAIRYRKADDTKGYYDNMPDGTPAATVSGNVVTMLLAPQMLTYPGAVAAQLELIQGANTVSTFAFIVKVEEDPSEGVVESEDYVNWVQWMANELTRIIDSGDYTGPKGDPFTYEDFTPEQLEKLRGPAGPQGKAFTYADFTPEQLAALTGPQGPAGSDGKTPVRGTDYWTAADIAQIKSYVDDAILGGAW